MVLKDAASWLKDSAEVLLDYLERTAAVLLTSAALMAVLLAVVAKRPQSLEWTLRLLDTHWRGCLLLAALLFYRTVHEFVEEIEEFATLRRNRGGKQGALPRKRP